MEKIQERSIRFVYEDYESTYDILLKKGNHDMLYIDLVRTGLVMTTFLVYHPSFIKDRHKMYSHLQHLWTCRKQLTGWIEKLLSSNIDGILYNAIKDIDSNTTAIMRMNGFETNLFSCNSGVRQGDVLSSILFSLFINGLAKEIKCMNIGIRVDDFLVLILLYADDIVLLVENEADLQCMIDKLHEWCIKWRMMVNESKTKIVHLRNNVTHCTNVCFKLSGNVLNKVEKYRYFGVILNEYLEYDTIATILSEASGRAVGAVLAKNRHLSDFSFKTFEK